MPSLKTMHLLSVKFSGGKSVANLLQKCPALEDLVVNLTEVFASKVFTLSSCKTLKTLTLRGLCIEVVMPWFRLPSLKTLRLLSVRFSGEGSIASFLPIFPVLECLVVDGVMFETPYPSGITFPYLEHLRILRDGPIYLFVYSKTLQDSNISSLSRYVQHHAHYNDPMILWKEPTVVPECLSTHLEIMEWRQYEGTEQERNVAAYVLANATCLKTARFSTWPDRNNHHSIILRELKSLNRGSETCQLLFD
ncbi:hypothetical protein DY000_02001216 [Brassica cretica]|uniref:FBD domain-containing protein n=1 Tax=Brassica cretica TaxID=69181 RepID=A0ABQ7BZN4_BRACR|nr:hypothetical protein DY000_02001216 [Brassica cretica]